MVAGSRVTAGAAVLWGLMMATMVSVSAQQIGNSQAQPSSAPSTPANGKPIRANPAPLVIACSGAFARDSHHLKLTMTYDQKNVDFGEVDAGPGKSMASIDPGHDLEERLGPQSSDAVARAALHRRPSHDARQGTIAEGARNAAGADEGRARGPPVRSGVSTARRSRTRHRTLAGR
jgi:hypothetical protein